MEKDKLIELVMTELGCKEEITKEYLKIALSNAVLFDKKQNDYGSGNISKFGELGVIVRSSDKIERLSNLLGKKENFEAKSDSWQDLANYGIIGYLCFTGKWPEAKKFIIKEEK